MVLVSSELILEIIDDGHDIHMVIQTTIRNWWRLSFLTIRSRRWFSVSFCFQKLLGWYLSEIDTGLEEEVHILFRVAWIDACSPYHSVSAKGPFLAIYFDAWMVNTDTKEIGPFLIAARLNIIDVDHDFHIKFQNIYIKKKYHGSSQTKERHRNNSRHVNMN